MDLFAEVGLAPSKSAARRTVKEGGAYVNNVKVADEDAVPAEGGAAARPLAGAAPGKKNLAAVEVAAG